VLLLAASVKLYAQPAPPNDNFAGALVISGFQATVTGSNVGATKETGETNHVGKVGGKSVWWSWTAPASGPVTLDTFGSVVDTLLAVYLGETLATLTAVAGNDDAGSRKTTSRVVFTATAGTRYNIVVDGFSPSITNCADEGSIVLNLWEGPLPPRIATEPLNTAALVNGTATLTVAAEGEPPLSFQWMKGGGPIAGATTNVYTISGIQSNQAGIYSVSITNGFGQTSSVPVLISVAPIVITSQPGSARVCAGYPVAFGLAAVGSDPLTYQWQRDGHDLAGATGASFSIALANYPDAGKYRCRLSNAQGDAMTADATLEVIPPYTSTILAGGSGLRGTNDGPGALARFSYPHGLAVSPSGNVYVTELGSYTVRKITPEGQVSTLAKLGPSSAGWNPFSGGAWGIAVDSQENVFITDTPHHTIVRITPNGTATTIAGTANVMGAIDGPAATAQFNTPSGLALDPSGNVFVADWSNDKIRRISTNGVVTTVAGSTHGRADARWTKAAFALPSGVGLDGQGALLIADEGNNAIRRVVQGQVMTLPGVSLLYPHGIAADDQGNIFTAAMGDGTVLKVTAEGLRTVIAGTPGRYRGDGAGAAAGFDSLRAVGLSASGTVYVTDINNHLVRKLTPFAVTTFPTNQTVPGGANLSLAAAATATGPLKAQWYHDGILLPGETNLSLALSGVGRTNEGVYNLRLTDQAGNWADVAATVQVLIPPTLQQPQLLASGPVRLQFRDFDGGVPAAPNRYLVQWRTNLPSGLDTNWLTLTNFYYTNGFLTLDDTNLAIYPARYYRVQAR